MVEGRARRKKRARFSFMPELWLWKHDGDRTRVLLIRSASDQTEIVLRAKKADFESLGADEMELLRCRLRRLADSLRDG